MRVLISGGAGFIGSHIAEAFLERSSQVLVLDNLSTGERGNLPEAAVFVLGDVTDGQHVHALAADFAPDVVVHFAAQTSVEASMLDPRLDASVNVGGTLSLLLAAGASGCRRFIFASSSTVYGIPRRLPVREDDPLQPIAAYGVSKLAGEHYVRVVGAAHGMTHVILRLGNVFGPRDSLSSRHAVTAFSHALLAGKQPVIEWDGEQAKDYVFVKDVARAVVAAAERGDDQSFNIAGERSLSVREVLEKLATALGVEPRPRFAPRRPGDVRRYVMDCSHAHEVLEWRPRTPLDEALSATVGWYRALLSPHSVRTPIRSAR
ncbi:MAG: NAD-dependent epimerase/dehydratase family protein [Chloroflexi bacterium]|nr:MAG: NAD-dependent epimerase/dehydratase family protein [Chloroflexota bacterium]